MEIYVKGNAEQVAAIEKLAGSDLPVQVLTTPDALPAGSETVVFDFDGADHPEMLAAYADSGNLHLFLNSIRTSLAWLAVEGVVNAARLYGFAGDPTFAGRPLLEVSSHPASTEKASELCRQLGIAALEVDDRVGLATPRVIAMIINEAYYTVMEGTASRQDIDKAMQLGTNYPMGPFEWARRWGLHRVYRLLEALYLDTRDERYKICPLLKKEYLLSARSE